MNCWLTIFKTAQFVTEKNVPLFFPHHVYLFENGIEKGGKQMFDKYLLGRCFHLYDLFLI